jgi:MFS family permease
MEERITAAPPAASEPRGVGRRAHLALTLLIAINLFNYIDRQVLAAVEPEVRKHLFPDDPEGENARAATGALSSAFLITYIIGAPLVTLIVARISRWVLIGVGVTLWSLASGASGLDWGNNLVLAYWILFLTRCFVGIGEAVYGPIAPALLSDLYPIKLRGRIMGLFYLAIPVGGALGYTLGGQVAGSWLGWRWAFYLVVPPGLLLGLLCFLMRDPPRGASDTLHVPARTAGLSDYRILWQTPSYVLNTLGMAGMTFAIGGMAFWMPDYLVEYRKVAPLGGIDPRTLFGGITVLAGLLATIAGSWAGDALRARVPGSYFLVSGIAMLVGFPMILLMIYTPFPAAWIFVFLAVFCLFFNTGPTNTILANVTHPSIRETGFAINILVIHVLGDVPSPPLMGYIAGRTNQDVSFIVVSLAILLGGLFWLWGMRYLERDTLLAPTRLEDGPPIATRLPPDEHIRATDSRIR